MDTIIKIVALCLVGGVIATVIKKNSPDIGMLLILAICVVALLFLTDVFEQITAFMRELIAAEGFSTELFSPLVKTVGIAIISRTGADLCRDADQASLASCVEMSGAFCAVLVALPLFEAVWDMLNSLL